MESVFRAKQPVEARETEVEGRGWSSGGRPVLALTLPQYPLFFLQEQNLHVELSCLLSLLRSQIVAGQFHSAQDSRDHVQAGIIVPYKWGRPTGL